MNTKLISAAAIVAAFGAATAFAGEDKVAAEGDWQTKLEAKVRENRRRRKRRGF